MPRCRLVSGAAVRPVPGSAAVNAWLQSVERDFELWSEWLRWEQMNTMAAREQVMTEGNAIVRHIEQMVERICKLAWMAEVKTGRKYENEAGALIPERVSCVRVETPVYVSLVCDELLKRNPDVDLAVASWADEEMNHYSVRARPGSAVSARQVAEAHGGGGHETAAGWRADVCDTF